MAGCELEVAQISELREFCELARLGAWLKIEPEVSDIDQSEIIPFQASMKPVR